MTAPAVAASEPARTWAARARDDWRMVLAVVLVASAAYTGWLLDRDWFPADDGALAHVAERVLAGELPHRDVNDIYTGGQAMLNAAAFRVAGISFWSMRLALFALFVAWVPAVFLIARRFARPVTAGCITLLAVVWSLPNYPTPMPSWYNLFLATLGVAALFRFLEDRRRWWLVAAGVAGGLSVLVKVVGLFYIAAALLFLVFQSHEDARAHTERRGTRGVAYSAFVTAGLLLFVGALLALVRRQAHAPELVHFVVPGALLAALLARDEWQRPAGRSGTRFAELARLMLPFVAGAAIPVLIFLVPYVRAHAMGELLHGVFVVPTRRFGSASSPMLPLPTLLSVLLPAIIVALGLRYPAAMQRRGTRWALLVALAALVLAAGWIAPLYRLLWNSARTALPVLLVLGALVVARARDAGGNEQLHRSRTKLLLAATALCSLVQFPFSVAIYFCYVAPLVALLALALFRYLPRVPAVVPAALVAFYLGFGVLRVNAGAQYGMGRVFVPASAVPFATLGGTRAGVRMPRGAVTQYDTIVRLLGAHARGGYTWASPDSPEIYVLAGLRNPTPSMYAFFDDTTGYTARTLAALEAHGVTAVVQNRRPAFSPPLAADLVRALEERYPNAKEAGPFLVRWR